MRTRRQWLRARISPAEARQLDMEAVARARELEQIRQALRHELRVHTGQNSLAQQIGISRGTLRKFLDLESVPVHRNLTRLRDWMENRAVAPVPLGAVCLSLLADELLPGSTRKAARRHLAKELAALFVRGGQAVPPWLAQEET
ncbi:MAG: hypothetical protein AB1941_30365 [Gemmatimonadota bacterium]